MEVSINQDTGMFVFKHSDYTTCMGIDNLDRNTHQLAQMLGHKGDIPEKGTLDQYLAYQEMVSKARKEDLGTWFSPGTERQVQKLLESARHSRQRIRVFYGDTDSGRDWMGENDVIGYVGRSTGPLKSPLLIHNDSSSGGGAILTDCIVRVIDIRTRRELYRHPLYTEPRFEIRPYDGDDLKFEVLADDGVHARFRTHRQATNWVGFMRGERFTK